MSVESDKIKFKVNNGRYAGSEVDLVLDQEYSLGRSFHCDIAIDDARFSERQMLLRVSQEGVQIKLLAEGSLSVNGESKDTKSQSEWRGIDPTSQFAMNELEFSLEVSQETLQAYQLIHQSASANTKSPQTAEVFETTEDEDDSHSDFAELETQVPEMSEQSSEFVEDTTQIEEDASDSNTHSPRLSSMLDFQVEDTPQNTERSKNTVSWFERNKLLSFGVAAGTLVGLLLIILFFNEPNSEEQIINKTKQMVESSKESTDIAQKENNDLAPDNNRTSSSNQTDNPFAAYDAMKNESNESKEEKLDSKVQNTQVEVIDHSENNDSLLSEKESTTQKDKGNANNQKEDSPSEKTKELSNKDASRNFKDESKAQQGLANIGQIDTSNKETQFVQDPKPHRSSTEEILKVMNGNATADLIAQLSVSEMVSGLGMDYLGVFVREPKKNETPPVIVVKGYVDSKASWSRAKAIIIRDVEGIGTFDDQVSTPSSRQNVLNDWIKNEKLDSKVQTYMSDRGIVAKVNLTKKQEASWNKIVKKYMETYDNAPSLYVMRDPGKWLKVKSISFGSKPYFVTEDNKVVVQGGRLPNGYEVVAIRRDGIEMKDQFGSYTYVF